METMVMAKSLKKNGEPRFNAKAVDLTPKRRVGRPRIAEGLKINARLDFFTTPTEKQNILDAARRAGLSIGAYLRFCHRSVQGKSL